MDAYQLAEQWLALDEDPSTRADIERLMTINDTEELERRMRPGIKFGTAGLRARAEAGFARMNCVTVIQTSQGLAQHLIETRPNAQKDGVVIGFDGRRDSRRFAEMTAAAFMEFGFTVIWLEAFSHTPLVPFSVKRRRAAGGVMVTASHNPKDDNGYKVYGSNGCQINTPEDEAISAMIKKNLVPRTWAIPDLNDQRPTLMKAYLFELKNMVKATRFPRFVYTPMHGVGLPYMQGALDTIFSTSESSSEKIMSVVPAQATPDPDFPTVKFPNPEEHGALDLAKTFANELDIDLIIANDPDADRLAVAQKVSGKWHQFKGDEVGALLGYYFFQSLQKLDAKQEITMLTSAVSSELLASMGQAEGFQVEETLTGFKWIGNRALQIGDQAVYGYEEALGYMIPSIAHDKDGIAAALTLLGACSLWGKLPFQVMQELYARYGYFDTSNTYFKSPDVCITRQTFDAIRSDPTLLARSLGDTVECRVRDLVAGTDTGTDDGKASLPALPENLMITIWLSGHAMLFEGVRCTIRASGTEPKIKLYVECKSNSSLTEAREGAVGLLKLLRAQPWFQNPLLQMESKYEVETRR